MKKNSFFCLFLLLIGFPSSAYEVSPVYQLLDAAGIKSQTTYTLKNMEPDPLMVEIFAYSVEIIDGEEVLTPADEQFLVLPPQAKISAESSQNFRVRFMSVEQINETKPYRVVFKQIRLPRKNQEHSELEMLINFSTLAFVSPPKSVALPRASVDKGMLTLKNEGNRVLDISKVMFEFSTESGKQKAAWTDITKDSSLYILPGYEKHFHLEDQLMGSSEVSLDYKP